MGKLKKLMTDFTDANGWNTADRNRQIEHALGYHKSNTMYECRYEERGHDYTLKMWREGHEQASRGRVTDLPDWLERVRSVALVGGHLKNVMVPPPDNIVWFTVDDDKNLINFIELS